MNKTAWALVLILIITSFLRLANITTAPPGLYPDEAMNGNNAVEALETGEYKFFYPENNGREGLYANIQAISVKFFDNTPWALRIPSALFGIFTVLGLYFLARELFGNNHRLALLSSFLLATSVWHIIFSRIGFRAIMAPFFMVWAAYFLLLALRKSSEKNKTIIYLALTALGGFLFGLGFHSYIAFRAMPLVFVALLPFYLKKKEFYIAGFVFLIFTALAFAPLGLHFVETPEDFFGRTTQISVFGGENPAKELVINTVKTLGMFNVIGDYNWRHNVSGRPALFWPTGIMFIVGAITGLRKILRRFMGHKSDHVKAYTFLFAWSAVAMLPIIVSNEGLPHALRAILMIPPVFILAGAGGMSIFKFLEGKMRNKQLFQFSAILLLGILAVEAYNTYFIRWADNPETAAAFNQNYVDIATQINALPQETEKVVIVEAGGVIVRDVPMPAQTVMYLTGSFTEKGVEENNIRYITGEEASSILISEEAEIFIID